MAENASRSHHRSDRRETSYRAGSSRGQRGRCDLSRGTSCPGQRSAPLDDLNERTSRNGSNAGSRLADADDNRFPRGPSVTMPRPAQFQNYGDRRASYPSDSQHPNEVHPAVASEPPLTAAAPGYSVFNGLYQIWNGQVYRGLIEVATSSLQHVGVVAMGTTSQETNPPPSALDSGSQRVGLASGPSQPLVQLNVNIDNRRMASEPYRQNLELSYPPRTRTPVRSSSRRRITHREVVIEEMPGACCWFKREQPREIDRWEEDLD